MKTEQHLSQSCGSYLVANANWAVHDLAGHPILQLSQCCSKGRRRKWNQQQRKLAATLNIWSTDPPQSVQAATSAVVPAWLFFLITAYSWRTVKSPEKVTLVQKGFWSGTFSLLFSTGLWSSIVFNCSQGVQILALNCVVYYHLLREF